MKYEIEGVLKWMWGDRDLGPMIISDNGKHFDPDDMFRKFDPYWSDLKHKDKKVKVTIIIEELENETPIPRTSSL